MGGENWGERWNMWFVLRRTGFLMINSIILFLNNMTVRVWRSKRGKWDKNKKGEEMEKIEENKVLPQNYTFL